MSNIIYVVNITKQNVELYLQKVINNVL